MSRRGWQFAGRFADLTSMPFTIATWNINSVRLRLPAQDQARTDARVTLTQPGIIQTGVGMDADLKNRTYRLRSQVNVRYDTQKR